MKKNKYFFEKNQTPLTKAKIKVYENYITGYLPKLLIQFNSCLIADLFSGTGKSGKDKGSPLILIEKIEYILTSPKIQEKKKDIIIVYNDYNKENIEKLDLELNKISYDRQQITITLKNKKFEDFLPNFLRLYKYKKDLPKFIFLDPYGYSDVKMKHLKSLINLKYTEILLFLPVFHTYRFAKDIKLNENHKTRIFLEEFTTKGVHNYDDVYDFMVSIKEKLKYELNLNYVRPLLLDAGSSKNSLFLLTKNRNGMILMNKIANKLTDDDEKNKINVKIGKQKSLFGEKEIRIEFSIFKNKLISFLKENNKSNNEIVEFTIQEGFLPKHAKNILKEAKDKIEVYDDKDTNLTNKSNKWNIAENTTKTIFFKWRGNEKN